MIKLRFDFVEKDVPGGKSYVLVDYRRFPANVLPAMLMFVCQEILRLPLPEDNPYKRIAQTALEAVMKAAEIPPVEPT